MVSLASGFSAPILESMLLDTFHYWLQGRARLDARGGKAASIVGVIVSTLLVRYTYPDRDV
jgi:hypothetical protein